MSWKHGSCNMFGGYRVDSTQVCDEYVRGKPDSKPKQGNKQRPTNLRESTDPKRRCANCGYFRP